MAWPAQVAKSDHSTGNHVYASYVMRSNDVVMAFTAPYAYQPPDSSSQAPASPSCPHPAFSKVGREAGTNRG